MVHDLERRHGTVRQPDLFTVSLITRPWNTSRTSFDSRLRARILLQCSKMRCLW
jgi:hypothetical protein